MRKEVRSTQQEILLLLDAPLAGTKTMSIHVHSACAFRPASASATWHVLKQTAGSRTTSFVSLCLRLFVSVPVEILPVKYALAAGAQFGIILLERHGATIFWRGLHNSTTTCGTRSPHSKACASARARISLTPKNESPHSEKAFLLLLLPPSSFLLLLPFEEH